MNELRVKDSCAIYHAISFKSEYLIKNNWGTWGADMEKELREIRISSYCSATNFKEACNEKTLIEDEINI